MEAILFFAVVLTADAHFQEIPGLRVIDHLN